MQPARKRGFDLFEGDGDEDEDNEEEEEEEDDDYRPQLGGRDEWKEQNGGDFEERERLYSIVPERCVPRLPASAAKKQYRGDPDRAAKKAWRDNKGWGAGVIALTCNKDNKGGKVFAQMVDLRGVFFVPSISRAIPRLLHSTTHTRFPLLSFPLPFPQQGGRYGRDT